MLRMELELKTHYPSQMIVMRLCVSREQLILPQTEDETLANMKLEADSEDSAFYMESGILYRKRHAEAEDGDCQIVVPNQLRQKVIMAGHNQAGHVGAKKSKKLIQAHFFWPQMGQDISQHCRSCPVCLKFNHKKQRKEPLHPLPVISTPWDRIAIDIVGKKERTKRGHAYILTIMDFATRYMEAIPLKRVDAPTTCSALLEVFARYGVPKKILSDNGSNFIASVTEKLFQMLGVYHIKSSPFHPETNGILERSHQVLKKTLDKLGTSQKDWDDYLPQTLMALRTAPHAALGISPFHLLFGRDARTPVAALRQHMEELETAPKSIVTYIYQLYQQAEECHQLVEREDSKAKAKSKLYYDRGKKTDPLQDGELVMVMVPKGEDSLTCKWDGPYKVLK